MSNIYNLNVESCHTVVNYIKSDSASNEEIVRFKSFITAINDEASHLKESMDDFESKNTVIHDQLNDLIVAFKKQTNKMD